MEDNGVGWANEHQKQEAGKGSGTMAYFSYDGTGKQATLLSA